MVPFLDVVCMFGRIKVWEWKSILTILMILFLCRQTRCYGQWVSGSSETFLFVWRYGANVHSMNSFRDLFIMFWIWVSRPTICISSCNWVWSSVSRYHKAFGQTSPTRNSTNCLRWYCVTFYHDPSPWNHHLGEYILFVFLHTSKATFIIYQHPLVS